MPKYKLRLVQPGDYIYCDGDAVYVGDTAADAHRFYIEEGYEDGPEFWVHPEILRGRIVYARDVENCECHEWAEPGDTTYDGVCRGDAALRPLKAGEIRTWPRGAFSPWWTFGPTRDEDGRWGPTYTAQVGSDVLGTDFPTREAAAEAVKRVIAERTEAWKAAHPEYRCEVPAEEEDEVRA